MALQVVCPRLGPNRLSAGGHHVLSANGGTGKTPKNWCLNLGQASSLHRTEGLRKTSVGQELGVPVVRAACGFPQGIDLLGKLLVADRTSQRRPPTEFHQSRRRCGLRCQTRGEDCLQTGSSPISGRSGSTGVSYSCGCQERDHLGMS